tara:strand:- start:9002 stop:13909 length:4908 start_codon:yes stop_codon:yes gene_type:complete
MNDEQPPSFTELQSSDKWKSLDFETQGRVLDGWRTATIDYARANVEGFDDTHAQAVNRHVETWKRTNAPLPVQESGSIFDSFYDNRTDAQKKAAIESAPEPPPESLDRAMKFIGGGMGANPHGGMEATPTVDPTKPVISIPNPTEEFTQKHPWIGGAGAATAEFVSGLTSPSNIELLVALAGSPQIIQKAASLGFATEAAHGLYESAKQLGDIQNPSDKAKAITGMVLNAGMMTLMLKHGTEIETVTPGQKAAALADLDKMVGERKGQIEAQKKVEQLNASGMFETAKVVEEQKIPEPKTVLEQVNTADAGVSSPEQVQSPARPSAEPIAANGKEMPLQEPAAKVPEAQPDPDLQKPLEQPKANEQTTSNRAVESQLPAGEQGATKGVNGTQLAGDGTAVEAKAQEQVVAVEAIQKREQIKKPVETRAPRAIDNEGRPIDGNPIIPGDVFSTSSGRTTTPYPKYSTKRPTLRDDTVANQWLIDNAISEAKARNDNFNKTVFSGEKARGLPPASIASMQEYLFGQQPNVPRPLLKPISAKTIPAADTTGAAPGLATQGAAKPVEFGANLTPMQRGRIEAELNKPVARRSSATSKTYSGSRKEVVSAMVGDGFLPSVDSIDVVKDASRVQWNRMDNRQQAAFEKRQREAGKKNEYLLEFEDGSSFVVTKSEYDYAKHLVDAKESIAAKASPDVLEGVEFRATDSTRAIIRGTEAAKFVSSQPEINEVTVSHALSSTPEQRRATESTLESLGWKKNPDYDKYHSWGRKEPVNAQAQEVSIKPEAGLAESIAGFAPNESKIGAKVRLESSDAQKLGITPKLPDIVSRGLDAVAKIGKEVAGIPRFTEFKEAVNKWVGSTQKSGIELKQLQAELERVIPGKDRREGITNWIQADGDAGVLASRAAATKKSSLRRGYEAAQNLTPDEIKVARAIQKFYADKLAEAQSHGIVGEGLENYVNQVWKRPFVGGNGGSQFAGKLSSSFKFGKQRTLESFFEGEQAGHVPATKDIAKLVASYIHEMNKTISTREMIKDLTTKKATDGRPLSAPTGNASVIEGKIEDAPDTVMIRPGSKGKDFSDYKTIANPSLNKWKWVHTDEAGNTTLVQGQLALHPEIYAHVKAMLGRSAIREWYDKPSGPLKASMKAILKGGDMLQGVVKATMLDLSPFHYVQEGTHAIGHKINPLPLPKSAVESLRNRGMNKTADFFDLPRVDTTNPAHVEAMNHGLMLGGDHISMEHFVDGISGSGGSLLRKIPYLGDYIKASGDYLFNEYIPRLKLKTYQHILERNTERFKEDVASGKFTESDIKYMSAQQANAAYGHLNYADIGRDPTLQHILRAVALAPDFLEARGRFTGQSLKPGKSGAEQRAAMIMLATTFYVTSRILNKTLDDDWHFDEPFGVKHGGRIYTMRSVPEDIYRLLKDSRRFVYGRLSPIVGSGVIQYLTGTNYRGEKVTWTDTTRELATRWVPLMLRSTPGVKALNPSAGNNPITAWEQFIGSVGLHISRHSPITESYKIANEWKKSQGKKVDTGSYPVSQYQAIRYALEDSDMARARAEYEKLLKTNAKDAIERGLKQSLMRPFTGSLESDRLFKKSLSEKDKNTVELAEMYRKEIYNRFRAMDKTGLDSPVKSKGRKSNGRNFTR